MAHPPPVLKILHPAAATAVLDAPVLPLLLLLLLLVLLDDDDGVVGVAWGSGSSSAGGAWCAAAYAESVTGSDAASEDASRAATLVEGESGGTAKRGVRDGERGGTGGWMGGVRLPPTSLLLLRSNEVNSTMEATCHTSSIQECLHE